jgi:MFS family permease
MFLAYLSGAFGFGFPGMIGFLLPLRAHELGAPSPVIGLIQGAGALIPAILSVSSGALADRIGPRKTFILGAAISGVAALLFATVTNYWVLIAFQALQGYARTMGWVATQTYITGVGRPEDREAIAGRFSFSVNAGPMIGALLVGAVADAFGYQLAFLFVACVGVMFAIVGVGLPEIQTRAPGAKTAAAPLAGYGAALDMLRLRPVQVSMLITFIRIWNTVGWQAFFPVFLEQHGMRPFLISTVVFANGLVSTIITLSAGRVARLASNEVVSIVSLAIGALGVGLSPHLITLPGVYFPSILMGIGYGISLPLLIAMMSQNAPPGQRGVAMGLRTQANQVSATVTPVAFGNVFPAVGITLGFTLAAGLAWAVLAAGLWLHILDVRVRRKPPVASGAANAASERD